MSELEQIENLKDWNRKKMVYSDPIESENSFGFKVSVSGNVIAIGIPQDWSGQNKPGSIDVYEKKNYNWNKNISLSAGQINDLFGWDVVISEDETLIIVGAPGTTVQNNAFQGKAFVYSKSGTEWIFRQELQAPDGEANDAFGRALTIQGRNLFIYSEATVGANSHQGKVYWFTGNTDGSSWQYQQTLVSNDGEAEDRFGNSMAISQDPAILIIATQASGSNKLYVFTYDGTQWVQNQSWVFNDILDVGLFGTHVSISENGSFFAFGSTKGTSRDYGQVYVYRNDGTNWNSEQNFSSPQSFSQDNFGMSVSVSNDRIVVGAPTSIQQVNKVFIFKYDGTSWTEEYRMAPDDPPNSNCMGWSVSISESVCVIGDDWVKIDDIQYAGMAYIYEFMLPELKGVNCTSLFSEFECFWDELDIGSLDIEFFINYNNGIWQPIQSPILDGNVFYQIFNSSNYANITGNTIYLIQLKACNTTSQICGPDTTEISLTTGIDSVKNLSIQSLSKTSFSISWKHPNVPVNNSIPDLDHYIFTYENENQSIQKNVSLPNTQTSYELNQLNLGTNYSISIYACRTEGCTGDDEGEKISSTILTQFGTVVNFSCSLSNISLISCFWKKPNDPNIPSYYHFTYHSIAQNDQGFFNPNSTFQNFTIQYPNQAYQMSVSSCYSNGECGDISTFQIGQEVNSSNSSTSKTLTISLSIVIPLVVIVGALVTIILVRKKKKKKGKDEISMDYSKLNEDK